MLSRRRTVVAVVVIAALWTVPQSASAKTYVPDLQPQGFTEFVHKPSRLRVHSGIFETDYPETITLSRLNWRRWGHKQARARGARLRVCGGEGCSTHRVRVRLTRRIRSNCGDLAPVTFYDRLVTRERAPHGIVHTRTYTPLQVC
jgi:hypothetical protein